jgi:thiamine biosynthesis lipoprotein
MQTLSFRAMGCQMLAALDGDTADETQLAAVPVWFERWEQQLSRFRPTSDLCRLNAAGSHLVVVSPDLWAVLQAALAGAELSAGLVRPTVLGALEAAGYDRSFDTLAQDVATPMSAGVVGAEDWRGIVLDPQRRTATLPPGVRLDLGGVAKGWAAERAAATLGRSCPALVDAGGDIAVSGPMADGSPWPIAIADPHAPERSLGTLLIPRGAVATSGRDERRWRQGGYEQHHIIDPRTGQPAQTDVLAATVLAPDGPSAEIAAKIALILGSRAGLDWIEARPQFAALLVLDNRDVLQSSRFGAFLAEPDLTSR